MFEVEVSSIIMLLNINLRDIITYKQKNNNNMKYFNS